MVPRATCIMLLVIYCFRIRIPRGLPNLDVMGTSIFLPKYVMYSLLKRRVHLSGLHALAFENPML